MPPWPEEVTILDSTCNIAGPYGGTLISKDYPNYINEWVALEVPHILALEFFDAYNRITLWEAASIRLTYPVWELIGINPNDPKDWNDRVRLMYNVTWAYLGYTEGQSEEVLLVLKEIKEDPNFDNIPFLSEITRRKDAIKKKPRTIKKARPYSEVLKERYTSRHK